jgi:hypothetical protein
MEGSWPLYGDFRMWCMSKELFGHTAVGRNNLNWCVCGLHFTCIGKVIVYIEVFNLEFIGENIDEELNVH